MNGRTAIGAEAAAVTFFDKHASRLKLHESALLAGLPQAPSQYNPFRNPTAAIERRNDVLEQMVENDFITQTEYEQAASKGLGLKLGQRYVQRREPYFFDYVQEKLIERYGVGVVRAGGLRIHTTIDPTMQDQAREAINSYYGDPRARARRSSPSTPPTAKSGRWLQAAPTANAASTWPHRDTASPARPTRLRAHRGGPQGVDPDGTSYTSKPLAINDPEFGEWNVKTFGDSYIGTVSLTRATLSSDNTVYAQLILDLGPEAVCKTAKLLGITTKLDCYPAEGLGGLTRGVTTLEMANAYATLAAGGVRRRATGIERVVFPDGKSEKLGNPEGKRVMTDGQAYEVTKILKMNVTSGTGTSANYGCRRAGKTGTTDEAKDAWFVGYTPELSAAVWVGYPDAGVAMPGHRAAHTPPRFGTPSCFLPTVILRRLPAATEAFVASPFFGKYSSTGGAAQELLLRRRLHRHRHRSQLRLRPLRGAATGGAGHGASRRRGGARSPGHRRPARGRCRRRSHAG